DFFGREFWRFVMAQQYVEKLALTAIDRAAGRFQPGMRRWTSAAWGLSDPATEAPVVRHLPGLKRRATDYHDTAQLLIAQLPPSSRFQSRPRSVRALRRDRKPDTRRCRVAR